MTRRKGTVMWRRLEDLPDVPLALDWTEQYPSCEKVSLVGIDNDDYVVQVWVRKDGSMTFLLLDPHETTIEDFSETED